MLNLGNKTMVFGHATNYKVIKLAS